MDKYSVHKLTIVLTSVQVVIWLVSCLYFFQYRSASLVAFDLKDTVQTFISQSGQLTTDKVQQAKRARYFDQILENTLTHYALTHHASIVVKQAVITAIPDITAIIQRQVAQKMKRGEPL